MVSEDVNPLSDSTAVRRCLGLKCAYRKVIEKDLCPRFSWISFRGAPTLCQVTRRRVPQVVEPEVGQPGALDGILEGGPNLSPVRSILAFEHATDAFLRVRLQGTQRRARRPVQGHAARLSVLRFV